MNSCVIRLTTSAWTNNRGLHLKKSITFLRRHCKGFNVLAEDSGNIGADEVIKLIVNLNECEDGVYEVTICNESTDRETGFIDDYGYKLVPFAEENS